MEPRAVEGDDAGGFLAAMLERMQAERGDGGSVGMAEDAEHAAFLAQPVAVEIVRRAVVAGCAVISFIGIPAVTVWPLCRRSTAACRRDRPGP